MMINWHNIDCLKRWRREKTICDFFPFLLIYVGWDGFIDLIPQAPCNLVDLRAARVRIHQVDP